MNLHYQDEISPHRMRPVNARSMLLYFISTKDIGNTLLYVKMNVFKKTLYIILNTPYHTRRHPYNLIILACLILKKVVTVQKGRCSANGDKTGRKNRPGP